jgi:hypothetical protein
MSSAGQALNQIECLKKKKKRGGINKAFFLKLSLSFSLEFV